MYRLKKSLGQHFLHDQKICLRIVDAVLKYPFRKLLEVGPGGGAITKYLLELKDIEFKAVEVDSEKVAFLINSFPSLENRIIHQNFLEMERPFDGNFTVVGNFPYNISSQILFKILDWKQDVETVVGMFQKEVAQRVAARSGNKIYGVLSVLVQAFYEVEYLFEVHENCFTPPPKVKSAVIRLRPRANKLIFKDERSFFLLVKTAFNQRRKTLRNAVKTLFEPTAMADEIFNKRAEQLDLEDFAKLTFLMR